ncbi:MAG: DNA-formamidopyrimidine glycosylase [Bacilli bacterium]|nr:DNA-formamidopyrimidine glycosylase [Bacilli bacterium]
MPELPEVETVRNTLKKNILNKKIKEVKVYFEKIIRNVQVDLFKEKLKGQEFVDILRRGKYLIFELNDYYLVSHLRMEGKYNLMQQEELSKHEHVVFSFLDGTNLRYHDVRKFGTMDLFPKMDLLDLYKLDPLKRVAPDPFEEDFSFDDVLNKLLRSKKPIKTALLDQQIISGIGNIYVDEILFMSGIHPLTLASNLDMKNVRDIIQNSKTVLTRAITLGGTTIKSFTSSHSISGRFQNELLVHTKEDCPNCSKKLVKIKVGGRTSYICEECQKMIDKN